jgi:hypothetical protein
MKTRSKIQWQYIVTWQWIDKGFGMVIGFIWLLKLGTTSSHKSFSDLQYTINKSLRHPLYLSSLLCLQQLSLGKTYNAADASASVFYGFASRWLSPISQQTRRCYAKAYNNEGCSTSTRGWHSHNSRFPKFLCCCEHNCCYADVAFRVAPLRHCLLCHCVATCLGFQQIYYNIRIFQ